MGELTLDINWVAVIVGAVAAYAFGALWYSPKMFGKKWMEGNRLTEKDVKNSTHAMIAQGLGTFLLAWVIGITERTDAIYTAVLIAITIAFLVKANGLWANKSKYAIKVESGFILAMVAIMILAHAIF